MYYLAFIIFIIPILLLLPTKIIGKKNVPRKTNFIFTCNHQSNWDSIIIEARIHRKFFILGKAELFKNKLLGLFLRSLHAYPVHRGSNDIQSVKYALRNLNEGKRSLLIFPQGTRVMDSDYVEVKNGTAMFALKTHKDIVPAVFVKRNRIFRRNVLIIGKPYNLSSMEEFKDKKIDKDILNKASGIIADNITQLRENYIKEQQDAKRYRNSRKHKKGKNSKNS